MVPSYASFSDHDWYWERGTRVDHPTQPNGTFVSILTWTCFTCTYSYLERCIFGDVRCPCRNISTHEQHGRTSGMSLAMVHYFSRIRLLVLHHCMVVSKIVPPRFESLHATSDDYVPQSCYPRAFQVMYARILQKVSNTGDQQRSHSMEPLVKPKSRY